VARPAPSLDVWGNAEVVPSTIPERGFDDATERGPIFVPDDLDVESIRSSREPRSLVTTQVAPEVVKLLRTRAALEGELAGTKAGFVPEPLVPMSGVESSEALLLTKKPVDPTGGLPNLDFDPPAANEVTAAMSPAAARQLLAESVKPLAPNTLPLGLTPADILAGRLGPAGSPAPPRAEPPRPEPPAPATPFAATMALGSRNDATKSPPGGLPLPTQSVQNTPSWPEVEASPRPPAVGLPAGASEGARALGVEPAHRPFGERAQAVPLGAKWARCKRLKDRLWARGRPLHRPRKPSRSARRRAQSPRGFLPDPCRRRWRPRWLPRCRGSGLTGPVRATVRCPRRPAIPRDPWEPWRQGSPHRRVARLRRGRSRSAPR
jgi:hypothetical protein